MSIREDAINGKVTPIFETCADNEGMELKTLMDGVAEGTIAIPKNNNHQFERITAIGKGTSTKVNANIGASKDYPEVQQELQKLCVCLKAGADTIHYVVNPDGAPAGFENTVDAAIAELSAVTGLAFIDAGTTSEDPAASRGAFLPD